jgi:hypothetical protein
MLVERPRGSPKARRTDWGQPSREASTARIDHASRPSGVVGPEPERISLVRVAQLCVVQARQSDLAGILGQTCRSVKRRLEIEKNCFPRFRLIPLNELTLSVGRKKVCHFMGKSYLPELFSLGPGQSVRNSIRGFRPRGSPSVAARTSGGRDGTPHAHSSPSWASRSDA